MAKKVKYTKVETVEEYLARGGKITYCDPAPYTRDDENFSVTTPTIHQTSLSESEIMFGEGKIRGAKTRKPKKNSSSINLTLIPADVRAKLGLGD